MSLPFKSGVRTPFEDDTYVDEDITLFEGLVMLNEVRFTLAEDNDGWELVAVEILDWNDKTKRFLTKDNQWDTDIDGMIFRALRREAHERNGTLHDKLDSHWAEQARDYAPRLVAAE